LPQDKVGQLEDRIALDARDADAWLALIGEHQAKGKISDARNTYERFFKLFPDLVRLIVKLRLIFRLLNGRIMPIWS
jgi:DNA-binding SARP family transcriptional activator